MFFNLIPSLSSTELRGRIFWILLSRLIIYGLLFTASIIFLDKHEIINTILIGYGILAIGFLIYLLAFNYRPHDRLLKIIIGVQIVFEFFIESVLVNHMGGNFSPLLVLFILSIVSATLVYGLRGTLIAATVAGLFYASPVLFDFSKFLPGIFQTTQLTRMGLSSDEAFYTVFLHLCLFYLIAFISGYMAQHQLFASRELRQIKLETDEILENMSSGMITVDSAGRLRYFNKAAGEILGINPDLAKLASYKSVFLKKYPELYYKIEMAMTTSYTEARGEIEIKIDDTVIPLGLSTSILKGEDDGIRGVIAVFQNLADVKLMEKRLRDSDRMAMIGQLSAGIAHEIRNPLASISGSVEVLSNSIDLKDVQDKKLLKLIIKESSRLNKIITEFLDFARINRVPRTRTDIIPVIEEVIALAQSNPHFSRGITIEFNHPDSPVYGRGGSDLYNQLLWNLILNSSQSIDESQGKISIACSQHIEQNGTVWTKLVVADNGPGIPPNLRGKIFDPFFSTKTDGTGLGLAIVSRIIDSLEGKIEFDTSSEETIFTCYFPPDADNPVSEKSLQLAAKT